MNYRLDDHILTGKIIFVHLKFNDVEAASRFQRKFTPIIANTKVYRNKSTIKFVITYENTDLFDRELTHIKELYDAVLAYFNAVIIIEQNWGKSK